MKKQKIATYLKSVFLLFTISILLWSCEKESSEIIPQNQPSISLKKVKKQFYASFNREAFSTLPRPQWDKTKMFYDNRGNPYLEIPFQTIHGQDIEKGTSVSFDRLIAFSKENTIELSIVHYFGIDVAKNYVDFKELSHKELYNFSGFVTRYDLNKNVIDIKRYNKGIDTNQMIRIKDNSKDDDLLSKVDEDTWEYTETTCTRGCWYWEYENGRVEVISCTQWKCTTTTYTGSNGSAEGRGNGNGTSTSYNTNKRTKCAKGYKRNTDGKCVKIVPQINVVNLKPCMQTIVGDIKTLANDINGIITKFSRSTPGYNWELKDGTLSGGTGATDPPVAYNHSTGTITTTFDSQAWKAASDLSWARTILHESVHAYLATEFAISRPNWIATYPEMVVEWGKLQNWNAVHHEEIARSIISEISLSLQEYGAKKGYNFSTQFYDDLSWGGLQNTSTFQNLNSTERKRILDVIATELTGKDSEGTDRAQKGTNAGC